jgi:glycosyltransferase involved in cell wall biosynthesis
LKILLACYFSLPHVGGVNSYLETVKSELEEHGHQVDMLAHRQDMKSIYKYSYLPHEFGRTVSGGEIDKSTNHHKKQTIKDVIDNQLYQYYEQNLPQVDPHIRWREVERYTFEIAAALLKLDGYDLIHANDILSTRALWRVKPKRIPLVATIHGLVSAEYLHSGMIKSRESLGWKYAVAEEYCGHMSADATIIPTKWQKGQLHADYGVPGDKITVIPYAFDLAPFLEKLLHQPYPPLRAGELQANKLTIACPARLVPEKDHKTLIEALSIVKRKRNDFVCWLIGEGKLRDELEMQAEKWGVSENLVFLGERWDVPALLRLADIVVLASIQDMHPFSLMEAQVAGKPCVASDAGGIPEVVRHGETGLIFEAGNRLQLAERILQLMSNPGLRSRLGANAAARGKRRYSAKTLYEKTMDVYLQAIAAKKSTAESTVIETPNLTGNHGLIKTRSNQDDDVKNIFAFQVEPAKFDPQQWSTVLQHVPADYSIPDPAFIRAVTD